MRIVDVASLCSVVCIMPTTLLAKTMEQLGAVCKAQVAGMFFAYSNNNSTKLFFRCVGECREEAHQGTNSDAEECRARNVRDTVLSYSPFRSIETCVGA